MVSRFWNKMKGSRLAFGLLSVMFCLLWVPSTGFKTLHLGSCVITTNLEEIQSGFSKIRDIVVCEGGIHLPASSLCTLSVFPGSPGNVVMKRGGLGSPYQDAASQEMSIVQKVKMLWRRIPPTRP